MAELPKIEELLPCSEDGCHPDGERHITECPAYYRERVVDDRNAALEEAAEVTEELLDEARDPWEIPGEIRKLKVKQDG